MATNITIQDDCNLDCELSSNKDVFVKILDQFFQFDKNIAFYAHPSYLEIQLMTSSITVLCLAKLQTSFFSSYKCTKRTKFSVDLESFVKMWKHLKTDKVRLQLNTDTLTIIIKSKSNNKPTTIRSKLLELESEYLSVPVIEYSLCFIHQVSKLKEHLLLLETAKCDSVTIAYAPYDDNEDQQTNEINNNGMIQLKFNGDTSQGQITLDDQIKILQTPQENFKIELAIRYFKTVVTSTPLDHVQVHFKEEKPAMFSYILAPDRGDVTDGKADQSNDTSNEKKGKRKSEKKEEKNTSKKRKAAEKEEKAITKKKKKQSRDSLDEEKLETKTETKTIENEYTKHSASETDSSRDPTEQVETKETKETKDAIAIPSEESAAELSPFDESLTEPALQNDDAKTTKNKSECSNSEPSIVAIHIAPKIDDSE